MYRCAAGCGRAHVPSRYPLTAVRGASGAHPPHTSRCRMTCSTPALTPNPRRAPREPAACVQVIVMYVLPLLVGVAVTDDVYGDWSVGYYGHVAQQVGGRGLAVAVTVAAAVSQVGMFEAEMSSDSYQVRLHPSACALPPTGLVARAMHTPPPSRGPLWRGSRSPQSS